MEVAVVGCGIAGLASALALRRRGHDVTVLEAFETPRPLGSGLLLQPSGLAALRQLGLIDEVVAAGARVERLEGYDRGAIVMSMRYADWRPQAFGLGVHRATLFNLLFDAAATAGARIVTGSEVAGFDGLARPTLLDAAGRRHGPFDLVVVADGSGSRLRRLLAPKARDPAYPWGAVWANASDPDGRFAGALHQRYAGCSVMIGVLPIGRGPDGRGDQVSFFWSVKVAEMDRLLASDLREWREHVERLWPEVAPIVRQVADPRQLSCATYRDVAIGSWRRGSFVLIGDAAHGTSPQLGQGANLALIDAVELAARVAAPADLRRYQAARRRQTEAYQLMSRALTPLFQSESRLWALVRRWLFAPGARAPVVRKLAALVLTGMFRVGRTPAELRP